jgi:hypothetical protein
MAEAASFHESSLIIEGGLHKYPPSWVDRFTHWVDRLRCPPWVIYVDLFAVILIIAVVIQWVEGQYPAGTIHPFHIFYCAGIPYGLAALHYLDRAGGRALDKFRPALDISEVEYVELRYRLTTMPPRQVLIGMIGGVIFTLVALLVAPLQTWAQMWNFAFAPLSVAYIIPLSFMIWITAGIFIYHTFHQLLMVRRIFAKYTRINLFDLGPIYALSGLTARTAIVLLVIVATWFMAEPAMFNQSVSLFAFFVYIILAIIALIWPIWGVHNLLLEEKLRLIGESNQRLEAAITDLHQRVDTHDLERMDDMNKTMASLEIEQRALMRIPTWPWQPDAIRAVVAAFMFPLMLWLIQWVLQRMITP